MSAESSWTLLKVIWQSCPDRFPNEIDPSIHHTTPTFVEQPFRISFSPFLSLLPIRSRLHLRLDARFDAPSAQLPLQQFTKLSSFPPRENLLEETCLLVFGRDSSSTLCNYTTFRETILLDRCLDLDFENLAALFEISPGDSVADQERFLGDKFQRGTLGNFLIFFVISKHIRC